MKKFIAVAAAAALALVPATAPAMTMGVGGTVTSVTPAYGFTDRSGTITSGGTAQQLAAANPARHGLTIINASSAQLCFSDVTTAVLGSPSICLAPGVEWDYPHNGVPNGAISIIGATTGQAFTAREF